MGVNERSARGATAADRSAKVAADVQKTSDAMPILCIREGNRRRA
jgi:hypothetical protein